MKINFVFETHIHADHISGARELARLTGAAHVLHDNAEVGFPFLHVKDEDEIELGNVWIRILHTPGHSPESMCLLITDKTRGIEPWCVLTGDTLFVGSVGRPDLPADAVESARALHESLHSKILSLPDFVEILPAHFSGSLCGKGMSGKPSSTISFEKRFNPFLSLPQDEFIAKLTAETLSKPDSMMAILVRNRGHE